MNRPLASVVVCCYNRGDRVSSCLESLVESTYPELELVLVDDGSTDDTAGVLERFRAAHTDTPVTIVSTEANLGVSAARNAGVDAACGELVFFTDSDCEVEPDWLERLVKAFGSGEVDAVAGRVLNPTAKNLAEMACFGRSGVRGRRLVGGNMGFRREVLLRYRFDEALRYGCDEDELAWRMSVQGCRFQYVPEACVLHRHPVDLRGYLDLAVRQGRGAAAYWYKRGLFVGRDVVCAVLALGSLPLVLAGGWWMIVPGGFAGLQAAALLWNQAVLQGKGWRRAILVFPVECLYSLAKTGAVLASLGEILIGRHRAVRDSKKRWLAGRKGSRWS